MADLEQEFEVKKYHSWRRFDPDFDRNKAKFYQCYVIKHKSIRP